MRFQEYHLSDRSRIVTQGIPGEGSRDLLRKQSLIEGRNVSYPKGIPIAFDRAKGAVVTDVDGNSYIDFFSSCGVMNLGHNNPDILDAVKQSEGLMLQAMDFPTKARIEFTEKFLGMLPEAMKGKYKINFGGPTGSDAVETALKLARINTGRYGVVAFQGGYHGMTMGALSVTSKLSHRQNVVPLIPGVHFAPFCSPYRCSFGTGHGDCSFKCIDSFREIFENPHSGVDKPAAIIIEPIQGEGGTCIPQPGWLEQIVDIARKNDVLVIFDEIQAGFYRTGKLFSFEHTNAIPDIVTMSKGIGGIGFPLSLVLYRNELDTWEPGTHIGTFRGGQLGFLAGLAALDFVERENIGQYVEYLGNFIHRRLLSLQECFDSIGEVRSSGLMFGIEYVKSKDTREPDAERAKLVRRFAYENGLLVELGGYYNNVVRFLPSLIITETLAKNGLDIFEKANHLAHFCDNNA